MTQPAILLTVPKSNYEEICRMAPDPQAQLFEYLRESVRRIFMRAGVRVLLHALKSLRKSGSGARDEHVVRWGDIKDQCGPDDFCAIAEGRIPKMALAALSVNAVDEPYDPENPDDPHDFIELLGAVTVQITEDDAEKVLASVFVEVTQHEEYLDKKEIVGTVTFSGGEGVDRDAIEKEMEKLEGERPY